MSRLRQRMTEDLRIRNYSPRTIKTYVDRVAKFARHAGKSPDLLGPEDVRNYQNFLIENNVSWTTFNQASCALRFFYRVTLQRGWMIEHIPFPKHEKRLPVILSRRELAALFAAVGNLKHRVILQTMYAAGLRISEVITLKVNDVDSQRMVLRVVQGKGRRDRYVPFSSTLLEILRTYWRIYHPGTVWLFPSESTNAPLTASTIQRACARARTKARIRKLATTHTLRHCFASHLLEAGVDLKTIQNILGHRSLNTTSIYLHIATKSVQNTNGPVDLLGQVKGGIACR